MGSPLNPSASINVLSICSGIGGLDLAIELAIPAARTVCYVERDAFAIETLVGRMEEGGLAPAPLWTDLRTFDGRTWRGLVDVLIGGYPCQPFSVAGKRGGSFDERHLWPDIARIIGECRPTICFFENVAGHLSLGFEEVAAGLETLGYQVAAGLFTAEEVGATHRRERLFILAVADDHLSGFTGQRSGGLPESERRGADLSDTHGCGSAPVADSNSALRQQSGRHIGRYELPAWPPSPPDYAGWESVVAAGRLDLLPALPQSVLRGMVDGRANRVDQLRALGNGVVPLQAAYAFVVLAGALFGASE